MPRVPLPPLTFAEPVVWASLTRFGAPATIAISVPLVIVCACVCVHWDHPVTASPNSAVPKWSRPWAVACDRVSGGRGEGHTNCQGRWGGGSPPSPPSRPLSLPTVPPVIKTGLPDLSTTEGSHVLLPCWASGSPEPTITWEKDGQPVSGAEGKFTIQPSGELLVKNLEVWLPPCVAPRGLMVMAGVENAGRAPRLSCPTLSAMQLLIPGIWGNRYHNPQVQMRKLRLRAYPVFPRHAVAERENQDSNLDLSG